jgi:predicted MFS family arabinose efflux permease
VAGLLLTGVLIDHVSIASVFWMLAGVSLLVALAVWAWVPRSPIYSRSRIDWGGAALLAGALAALMLAVSQGNAWGWSSARVLALFAAAAVLTVAWVAWARTATDPLVDLRLLARRSLWRANAVGFATGLAYFIPFALVPLIAGYPESTGYGLGLTSTQVALVLAPGAAAALAGGMAGGSLVTVVGARRQAILANVLVVASYVAFLTLPKTAPGLAAGMIPLGLGIGLGAGAIINLTLRGSDEREAGVTAGLNTVVRTVGQAIGPQVAVAVVVSVPLLATGLPSETGFDRGFLFGLIAAAGALAAAWIVPAAGDDPLLTPTARG